MYRILAAWFSITVIVLSLMGIADPTGGLSILMSTQANVTIFRIVLCSLLLAYSIAPKLRYDLPRKIMTLGSVGVVWFFIMSLFTDGAPFPGPLDLFFGLEGAVLATIAVLEFERPKAAQRFVPRMEWAGALFAKVKQLRPSLSPSRQKHA